MTLPITRQFLRAGATALILSTVTSVSMFVSADAVYAERGGNGNGNGNSGNSERSSNRSDNSSANRSNNGNANRSNNGNAGVAVKSQQDRSENANGRGVLARELRGLNAAHANQTALENASPNSMPGKLYIYQQEQPQLREDGALAAEEYDRLTALSPEEVLTQFSDGDYAAALDAVAGDADELSRLDALAAEAIAVEFPDGDYATALADATDNPVEIARLEALDAMGIVAEFPSDDYVVAVANATGDPDEIARLEGLSASQVAAEFPDGAYASSIEGANGAYLDTQEALIDSLLVLSGDRLLSDEALAELDRLLGL